MACAEGLGMGGGHCGWGWVGGVRGVSGAGGKGGALGLHANDVALAGC